MPNTIFGARTPGEMIAAGALQSIPWLVEPGLTREQSAARIMQKFPDANQGQALTLADRLQDIRTQAQRLQNHGIVPPATTVKRDPSIPADAKYKYQVLVKYTATLTFADGTTRSVSGAQQGSLLSDSSLNRDELEIAIEDFMSERIQGFEIQYKAAINASVDLTNARGDLNYELFAIVRR